MKEFRYIFKVDHTNPEGTLKLVGEMVAGEPTAFQGVDVNFVNQQDFITAVPIEIALTMDMRAKVIYTNPECRFVITGIPVFRVQNLIEFGYQVVPGHLSGLDEKLDEKEDEKEGDEDPKPENVKPCVKRCPEGKEVDQPVEHRAKYWVGGKEVSKEEFLEKVKEIKKGFEDAGFNTIPLKNLFAFNIL